MLEARGSSRFLPPIETMLQPGHLQFCELNLHSTYRRGSAIDEHSLVLVGGWRPGAGGGRIWQFQLFVKTEASCEKGRWKCSTLRNGQVIRDTEQDVRGDNCELGEGAVCWTDSVTCVASL